MDNETDLKFSFYAYPDRNQIFDENVELESLYEAEDYAKELKILWGVSVRYYQIGLENKPHFTYIDEKPKRSYGYE